MDSITLGQIFKVLGAIAGASATIGAVAAIFSKIYSKTIGKSITNAILPLQKQITDLNTEMLQELEKSRTEFHATANKLDISECRNFLVRFLGDIERGEDIDPVEIERAYEIIQHYTDDLGQNSYIHDRWDQVMKGRSKAATIKKYSNRTDKQTRKALQN